MLEIPIIVQERYALVLYMQAVAETPTFIRRVQSLSEPRRVAAKPSTTAVDHAVRLAVPHRCGQVPA